MKLLILCNDFPPLNSIGAQRPYSWYRYLKEFGVEPIVISKNWKGFSSNQQEVLKNAGESKIIVEETEFGKIIRVPIELTISEKMLLKYGDNKYSLLRRFLTLLYRLLRFPFFYFDSNKNIYKAAKEYLSQNRVDAVITTGEPFILFKYGYRLNKEFSIPWIADFRDGWYLNYVMRNQSGMLLKLLRKWEYQFEKKYLPKASLITSIDPILGKLLSELHNQKNYEIIYNGFDGKYLGERTEPNSKTPLILNHSGTLTPGQRVEEFLAAIKELIDENKIQSSEILVCFIGLEYFTEQNNRVLNYSSVLRNSIVSTERISREEVYKKNTGADYLLTFSEEKFKMINAKTYDYIAAQRPNLVIPDDESLMTEIVYKTKSGFALKNKEDIKEFLLKAIVEKRSGNFIAQPQIDWNVANQYTRKEQAHILANIIKKYFNRN